MLQFSIIKNKIRTLTDSSDEISASSALPTAPENLLSCTEESESHEEKSCITEFAIKNIKQKGFHVLCEGKAGYICYREMPWKYRSKACWKAVFRYLLEYTFPAEIIFTNTNTDVVFLDGRILQFPEPYFNGDQSYKAIIIVKTREYIILEFGYHFDWEYGSILVKIPFPVFRYDSRDKSLQLGQILKMFYCGTDRNDVRIFCAEYGQKEWLTNEIEETLKQLTEKTADKTIPVIIEQMDIYPTYTSIYGVIENKYNVEIPIGRSSHTATPYKTVVQAIEHLAPNDIIHCELLHICKEDQNIIMKWNNAYEITQVAHTKPVSVGNIVAIEVIKQKDAKGYTYSSYFLDNIHPVILYIYNQRRQINTEHFNIIERNLQNRDTIDCEIISIKNNTIVVRWDIQDEEFERFIK